jgi:hypothetical protein
MINIALRVRVVTFAVTFIFSNYLYLAAVKKPRLSIIKDGAIKIHVSMRRAGHPEMFREASSDTMPFLILKPFVISSTG